MRTYKGARVAVVVSLVAGWGALGFACAPNDENPATTRVRTTDSGADGTVDPTSNPDAALGAPICGRYGGYANVKTIADAILTRAAADCRISGGFADANSSDGLKHLRECFEIQLGSAFQCDGVAYEGGKTKDSDGNVCRDMTQAHRDLPGGRKLRNADFDAFTDAVAAELQAHGVTDKSDLQSVAAYFEGFRNLVVQTNNQPKANTYCDPATCSTCTPVDAGPIDSGTDTGTDASDASDQ